MMSIFAHSHTNTHITSVCPVEWGLVGRKERTGDEDVPGQAIIPSIPEVFSWRAL